MTKCQLAYMMNLKFIWTLLKADLNS